MHPRRMRRSSPYHTPYYPANKPLLNKSTPCLYWLGEILLVAVETAGL